LLRSMILAPQAFRALWFRSQLRNTRVTQEAGPARRRLRSLATPTPEGRHLTGSNGCAFVPGGLHRLYVGTLSYSGVRAGEVTVLSVGDVDLARASSA